MPSRCTAVLVEPSCHLDKSLTRCGDFGVSSTGTNSDHDSLRLIVFSARRLDRHRRHCFHSIIGTVELEPGWVPTKMGGPSAPGDLRQGSVTQAWPATSEDVLACSTGGYFYHQRPRTPNPMANNVGPQQELLAECGRISGIPFPD